MPLKARRLFDGPVIRPHMDGRMGDNINGPSLIAAPPWIEDPLGRYYLYFADHKGRYIRLAIADALEGPWRTYEPGCLDVSESFFCTEQPYVPGPRPNWARFEPDWPYPHIASPDVHCDVQRQEIRMYFHGLLPDGSQSTRVALSQDGIQFQVRPELLGPAYFRVFRHHGWHYALAQYELLRSRDGLTDFEAGPRPLPATTRHTAVLCEDSLAQVFWSQIGDAPERIYHATMDLGGDWQNWHISRPHELLRPEEDWEGSEFESEPSQPGALPEPANQLRDPCLYQEGERFYLLYSVAGEHGIAIAELEGLNPKAADDQPWL